MNKWIQFITWGTKKEKRNNDCYLMRTPTKKYVKFISLIFIFLLTYLYWCSSKGVNY